MTDSEQMQKDIYLLLSVIDTMTEATGEGPDVEDEQIVVAIRREIVVAIRRDWHKRETGK